MTTRLMDLVNRKGKSLSVRLRGGIHPKHLAELPWHGWYLPYLDRDDVVLDVGCGTGAHANRAATSCKRVIGIDRVVPRYGLAEFISGDVTHQFPFGVEFFDAVLLLDVLEHIVDRHALLTEISRVLKPSGYVFVSVPNRDTTWRRRLRDSGLFSYSDPDHKTEYVLPEIRDELRHAGLMCVDVSPSVYDTPWAGVIDVVGGVSLSLYRRLAQWKRDQAVRHPEESTGFQIIAMKT